MFVFLTLICVLSLGGCSGGGGGSGDSSSTEDSAGDSGGATTDAGETGGDTGEGSGDSADAGGTTENTGLTRAFKFTLPLFSANSAWNQSAVGAAVAGDSDQRIQTLYRSLRGDTSTLVASGGAVDWPFIVVNYDDFSIPIFQAGDNEQSVIVCDYDGVRWWPGPKFPNQAEGGPVTTKAPIGQIRPSGPVGMDSDGHVVLYHPATATEYEFWAATTQRNGECQSLGAGYTGTAVLEAGAVDFFNVTGTGSNAAGESSARAMGVALLAGAILPEDIENGVIAHALAFAIPGPRNLSSDPSEPNSSDYQYPTTTTETDHYSTDPHALKAGERIRLKSSIVGEDGSVIDESALSPVSRMFLTALRNYGAYLTDASGGFTFYAEDIHTGSLNLSDDMVNELAGNPPGTAMPAGKTKWQVIMEALDNNLSSIPVAAGYAPSSMGTTNFEVVSPAVAP